ANSLPVTFWARDIHWRGQSEIGSGHFTLFGGDAMVMLDGDVRPDGMDGVDWRAVAARNPDARAYLVWARMPFVERREGRTLLRDQRFTFDGIGDRFTVDVTASE
ncbi:MAG: metal-dependent hydrolase, partial [Parasphingopyxis sp.]